MIKTKTGLADEYLKQITETVKPVYDEEKKAKDHPRLQNPEWRGLQSSGFQYPDPG